MNKQSIIQEFKEKLVVEVATAIRKDPNYVSTEDILEDLISQVEKETEDLAIYALTHGWTAEELSQALRDKAAKL